MASIWDHALPQGKGVGIRDKTLLGHVTLYEGARSLFIFILHLFPQLLNGHGKKKDGTPCYVQEKDHFLWA